MFSAPEVLPSENRRTAKVSTRSPTRCTTHFAMAHAYKAFSRDRNGSSPDSDDSGNVSSDSSVTIGREPSPSSDLPLELKSRILMLTSRGVSHRLLAFPLTDITARALIFVGTDTSSPTFALSSLTRTKTRSSTRSPRTITTQR